MTMTPDQLTARRRTNGRTLKIAGAVVGILFAIGLVGSCAKPAADTTAPTQAPVTVFATATPQPPPAVRPTDVPKPTLAPQSTTVPAKPTQAPAPTTAPVKPAAATSAGVAAKGGDCPDDHPIKGNASSKIYHVRGGASYARTDAEQCFDTPASAQAAGYRAAAR